VVEVIACITHPLHSLTLTRAPCPVPGGTSSPWKNHLNPTSKPPSPKRHPLSPHSETLLLAPCAPVE
jgi:hypothetical protein